MSACASCAPITASPCGGAQSGDIEAVATSKSTILPTTAASDVPATDVPFRYSPMFQHVHYHEASDRRYVPTFRHVPGNWVSVEEFRGRRILNVRPGTLARLAEECISDVQHFFRHDHLEGWRRILLDPESSSNDRFVATQLLKNACVAAGKVLPACQDTGTALILAKRGELVWTGGVDESELAQGVHAAYTKRNLRYSQVAPLNMFDEVNTNTNLPVQIDMMAISGNEYETLVIAKGGGSANKSMLYQMTKALLNPKSLRLFIKEKLKSLGTAACPPYHIALVIGGTSAEATLKTVKLASCRYYDDLPTTGDDSGRAFRDLEWEDVVMEEARQCGIGAQFGGKYFAHQARVIRLPRHGASCPVGIGVSCSADRQILAKITEEGLFIEQLETDPARFIPAEVLEPPAGETAAAAVVRIDLCQPMDAIRRALTECPVKARLSLTGPLIVARDIAHAKIKQALDQGKGLPQYFKDHIIYYAGPAKTPQGYASGSFGPTTAGRMDSYVGEFMAAGGSFVMLAKGNRSPEVTKACKEFGGFYLGSIGGPAAILAQDNIRHVEVVAFPELGMEAVWRIDVVDFPAFMVVDDKGNDFFAGMI